MQTSGNKALPVAFENASPVVVPITSLEFTEHGHDPSGLIGRMPNNMPPIAGTGVNVTWPRSEISPVRST